jgi:tetratricopeptide (TPR) repeat protein
MNLRIV